VLFTWVKVHRRVAWGGTLCDVRLGPTVRLWCATHFSALLIAFCHFALHATSSPRVHLPATHREQLNFNDIPHDCTREDEYHDQTHKRGWVCY